VKKSTVCTIARSSRMRTTPASSEPTNQNVGARDGAQIAQTSQQQANCGPIAAVGSLQPQPAPCASQVSGTATFV
jgi:hypothetical protein